MSCIPVTFDYILNVPRKSYYLSFLFLHFNQSCPCECFWKVMESGIGNKNGKWDMFMQSGILKVMGK